MEQVALQLPGEVIFEMQAEDDDKGAKKTQHAGSWRSSGLTRIRSQKALCSWGSWVSGKDAQAGSDIQRLLSTTSEKIMLGMALQPMPIMEIY
ncbi:MAG: hypothetical protein KGY41_11125 [Desulfovermiculus sp.]|nr:hypothetical protein [Desulfovermiculus sp.]